MHRWVDHTAELELEIVAAGEAEVYADALAALAELLDDAAGGAAVELRTVGAQAPDRAARLAEWLGELAYAAEVEGFVPIALEALALDGQRVRARVRGRRGAPPHLVKGVTYHRLEFARRDDGRWAARVVLDV